MGQNRPIKKSREQFEFTYHKKKIVIQSKTNENIARSCWRRPLRNVVHDATLDAAKQDTLELDRFDPPGFLTRPSAQSDP